MLPAMQQVRSAFPILFLSERMKRMKKGSEKFRMQEYFVKRPAVNAMVSSKVSRKKLSVDFFCFGFQKRAILEWRVRMERKNCNVS